MTTPIQSVLDVQVSCFANYKEPNNPQAVNLLTWLRSTQYQSAVEAIRAATDKAERDRLKATLPAITPSGLFTYRNASARIQHSGLICLDIDLKGNERIGNYADLKDQLCNLNNVAYCGRSVSGTGYFVLIPITYPDEHQSQFNALKDLFKRLGIRIDNTGDVARLRGYSYDASGFFRHDATPFTGLYVPPLSPPTTPTFARSGMNVPDSESTIIQQLIALVEAAPDGEKDNKLYNTSMLAGGHVTGSAMINQQTAIDALEDAVRQLPNVASFTHAQRTIRNGIRDGKLRPIHTDSDTPERATNSGWQGGKAYIWGLPLPLSTTTNSHESEPVRRSDAAEQLPATVEVAKMPLSVKVTELRATTGVNSSPSPDGIQTEPICGETPFTLWQRTHPYFSQIGLSSINLTSLN